MFSIVFLLLFQNIPIQTLAEVAASLASLPVNSDRLRRSAVATDDAGAARSEADLVKGNLRNRNRR